jgi:Acetoacetate decarboxylase (ADC)
LTGGVEVQEDFFKDVRQVELTLPSGEVKFPVFYYDARMFTLVLPADWLKLRRMLPDSRFQPVQIFPGVGAVALTAFEYFDTDIRPYNEFSMGILLNAPHYLPVPGLNMLRQYFDRFMNVYIYHLPVTTEVALRAGIDYYNYPKFLADILFTDSDEHVTCDLFREEEHILTISGEKIPTRSIGEMKIMCNLYQHRQPQIAEFKANVIEGTFSWLPSNVSWAFNRSNDIGSAWADLVVGNRAVMYIYMPKVQFILYGPDHLSMPLLQQTLLTKGFLPGAAKKAAKKPAGKKAAAKKKPE